MIAFEWTLYHKPQRKHDDKYIIKIVSVFVCCEKKGQYNSYNNVFARLNSRKCMHGHRMNI